jgi:vacuolar protein sorting-associated protein 16
MECDGVRILTSMKHEFLQMVPKCIEEIFRIGANGPSAMLYEASISYYKERSQRSDEYIRAIKAKKKLEEAISNCIEAASNEYDPINQKALLYASLFGRYFEEFPNPSQFVDMCQTLRVLNAIRHHSIAIPITYSQYEALTPQVIINRLVLRNHYALALKICEYLNIPDGSRQILKNWSLFKVKQIHEDDNLIAQLIREKLGDSSDISYAEIAQCAIDVGRHELAIKLLEYETKASDQVPLYMKIKNQELALKKAIESGDSDLIYMVLFWLKEKFNNVSDFMKFISKNEVAMSLMLQYYRQNDINKLCDILNQENKSLEQAMSLVKVAYKQTTNDQKLKLLDEAQRLFRGRDEFNYSVCIFLFTLFLALLNILLIH